MANPLSLPALPLDAWEQSKVTLNFFVQIVGKVRLNLAPRKNHWWYITLHVSSSGLTTRSIPFDNGLHSFEIVLNFLDHKVELTTSRHEKYSFPLEDGLSVASFYKKLMGLLQKIGLEPEISDKPIDLPSTASFGEIEAYHTYQPEYVERFWRILLWVDDVFKEFSGRFYGKTCPVHLYWHHMDLTVTRFSGNRAPAVDPGARIIEKDAYSHEVISFGFWAGDENVRDCAFYSYTHPSPEGLGEAPLLPEAANWVDSNGSPMAILMYEDVRTSDDPRSVLLSFLESTYQAGAKRAGWPVEDLTVPALNDL